MSVTPSPIGGFAAQFFDNNGNPLSGGKIYTYAAGTTTPQASYTSASGTTPHSNPIVLDSAGRVPGGEIWLTDGLIYKFVIETATAVLIGTYDNITGVNSNFVNYTIQEEVQTATAGQTVFNLSTVNYTPGTNSLSVYIDGVNQYVGDSYLETDSDTVTFTAGLHVGAEVKFTTAAQITTGAVDASSVGYVPPFTGGVAQTATNVQTQLDYMNLNAATRGVFNGYEEKGVYDTFDRADSLLNGSKTSSNQTWVVSGAGAASAAIVNNCFTATANTYAYLPYAEPIKNINCTFSLSPALSGSTNLSGTTLTLITDVMLAGLSNMLHLIVSPSAWVLQKRLGGGAFVNILDGEHNLLLDGAVYQVAMRIDGNTVIVTAPNGQTYSVTDTDVGLLNMQFGCWQLTSAAGNAVTKIHSVSMGNPLGSKYVGSGVGAPMAEATFARGTGLTKRQKAVTTLSGGAGWYRVATQTAFTVFLMSGEISVKVQNAATFTQVFQLSMGAVTAGPTALTQLFCQNIVGAPFTQARLSTDSGSNLIGLDLYLDQPAAANIEIEYFGYFTPVLVPVVGATALPTSSTVLTLQNAAAIYGDTQILKAADADQSAVINVSPTSGGSATIPTACSRYIFFGGVIATYTLTMPANPVAGQLVTIAGNVITAITISPNTGQNIQSPPTTLSTPVTYFWYAAVATWVLT